MDIKTARDGSLPDCQHADEVDRRTISRLWEIADKYKVTGSQVAMAWIWSKPVVSSPIVGISKPHFLEDLVRALDVRLTAEDIAYLEEEYASKRIMGFHQGDGGERGGRIRPVRRLYRAFWRKKAKS